MHMADSLITPVVGIGMIAASAGVMTYSVSKLKENMDEKKIAMMGIMGAFVFAGQMINFTIPGTGSSGHIGGGLLLAAILGPHAGFVVISAVLIIQAMFFGDGGLLALGCNIFNMGFYTCFLVYPLIYKPIVTRGLNTRRITIAAIIAIVAGLQFGAFSVVIETLASGVTQLPFRAFVMLMQPIHVAIGLIEGIVTAGILCFVYAQRPEILQGAIYNKDLGNNSIKKVAASLLIMAMIIGGGVSLFASSNPDGLEWAIFNVSGVEEIESEGRAHEIAQSIQGKTALMPDYGFKDPEKEGSMAGTSAAGIAGGFMTLLFAVLGGKLISLGKKHKGASK
ncbi:MAG: energy-coupling factor ABC transporter permease [Proteocatella sp.]